MKRRAWLFVLPLLVCLGCGSTPPPNGGPVDQTGPQLLRSGVSVATQIGMSLVHNQEQAKIDAGIAKGIIETDILPLFDKDAAKISVADLLNLGNLPVGSIVRIVLTDILPLLVSAIHAVVPDWNPTSAMTPIVKAYFKAFFQGADDGLIAYLGGKAAPNVVKLR
jgi:hypothetical protein